MSAGCVNSNPTQLRQSAVPVRNAIPSVILYFSPFVVPAGFLIRFIYFVSVFLKQHLLKHYGDVAELELDMRLRALRLVLYA